jgi:acylphosphatase
MSEVKAMVARVTGRVQGVWFRDSARQVALDLQLSGWVQNLADGTLQTFAQGVPSKLDAYVAWLEHGPPRATVIRVEHEEAEPDPHLGGFEIR